MSLNEKNVNTGGDETAPPYWRQYPITYRADEMRTLAGWITAGESGSVVGLPGSGRATLLNYLCYRPDALETYLPAHLPLTVPVLVDLNNLPDNSLATLYRVFLRSFYEMRARFDPKLQQSIASIYRKHEAAGDPFLPQSGLRELLLTMQAQECRIILVLDRFDRFCRSATSEMTQTLRGLRDSFKDTLSYVVGMHQEVIYLSDWAGIEPVYHLLDTHICWVKPLEEVDAWDMIQRHTGYLKKSIPDSTVRRFLKLTGRFPALLRVTCRWWAEATNLKSEKWLVTLLARPDMRQRLELLLSGLSQEEQFALMALSQVADGEKGASAAAEVTRSFKVILQQLVVKGVCGQVEGCWQIESDLLAAYISTLSPRSRGKMWLDEATQDIHLGQVPVETMKPQERAVLQFLLEHPYLRLSHSEIIEGAWPEEVHKEGVSTEALYQAIRGIRKKIEPDTRQPCYIINWRGQTEGGYQCFPEGRPHS